LREAGEAGVDRPEMGRQANIMGSPKAMGKRMESAMPMNAKRRVWGAGKMRRNMKRKQSLLRLELRK
jgi:hypothetical protein